MTTRNALNVTHVEGFNGHLTILLHSLRTYLLDVLWGQPIKLIQVVSTSEFHEY